MKGKLIEKIIEGDNLDGILLEVSRTLFERGPVDGTYLEMLSYFKLYQPDYFAEHEEDLLEIMGLFSRTPSQILYGRLFLKFWQKLSKKNMIAFLRPCKLIY